MMSGVFVCQLLLLLTPVVATAQNPPCVREVAGTVEITSLTSQIFGNTRNLRVWLPSGYSSPADSSRTYPVLYMMDGQILFDACAGRAPEWKIDETLTRLIGAGKVPPLIVVGVDFSRARNSEYLPYKDTVFAPDSPEPAGKRFPEFLANEVIPVIRAKYRISSGPQTIGGSSYGAVAALHAILARPDLFDSLLLESPSLAVGNGQFLRDTEHLFKGPARVYLGVGGVESGRDPNSSENRAYVASVRILERNLKAVLVDPPIVLTVVQPEGAHTPVSWAARFEEAARFLFPIR